MRELVEKSNNTLPKAKEINVGPLTLLYINDYHYDV
jgi:hypothetical protein